MNIELDELRESIRREDLDKSNAILQRIWERRPDFDECCMLLELLDDDYDDVSTMYGIVHALERALPDVMYLAISRKLESLFGKSPELATSLVVRNLAAKKGQISGHSAYRFLDILEENGDRKCLGIVRDVYSRLKEKGELKQVLVHSTLM